MLAFRQCIDRNYVPRESQAGRSADGPVCIVVSGTRRLLPDDQRPSQDLNALICCEASAWITAGVTASGAESDLRDRW
jgi:hypothetical protein